MTRPTELGPRRAALLSAWGEYAATEKSGPYHDFGPDNRYERVQSRLTEFLRDPTEESFEQLWHRDVLRDAVMGGPGLVLREWPGTLDELADQLGRMQSAAEYDPAWERKFITKTAVRELYGFMDPSSRPILSSTVTTGLNAIGFPKPTSYQDRSGYDTFADIYDQHVGHATAGTDHAVPWHFELEQFLAMLGAQDRRAILEELPVENKQAQLMGWHAEGQAGRITFHGVDALVDKYLQTRMNGGFGQTEVGTWGGNYWESWKWTHARHIRDNLRTTYDITALDPGEIEKFIEIFRKAPPVELSSSVPTYLLGGQSGGILWNDFKNRSLENPDKSAEVLSTLFDETDPIRERLRTFNDWYSELTSGGPLLSLATVLLMLTYPDRYVMYKYGKFASFFGAYSDYEVSTGFDATQYWVLNEACERLRRMMDETMGAGEQVEMDASMLDVHTLIWVGEDVEDL